MKPVYTNTPVNREPAGTRDSSADKGAERSAPLIVPVIMTFVLASMFIIRGAFPPGGNSEDGNAAEETEAAYVYGEFSGYADDDSAETGEEIALSGDPV